MTHRRLADIPRVVRTAGSLMLRMHRYRKGTASADELGDALDDFGDALICYDPSVTNVTVDTVKMWRRGLGLPETRS